ncbi:MCE family protein [Haloechinothrix sp. YIM 98757]|uniref:MCE family protein n=2 Tax=Haloechinothrix aidingensis TaxID=2752311 RepID=A0A838ABZ7_9PSEU|nr:MCE family protein [Haloechinothrix aidingensis]
MCSVAGFVAIFVFGFAFLWTQAGGVVPGVNDADDYQVAFQTDDVKNVRADSDVTVAGVVVGRVAEQTLEDDGARMVLSLDREVAPLHEGAAVRVGMKSVTGQSQVAIEDGDGPELPDGATLPKSAVRPAVEIDEVLKALDSETREALSETVRSLGEATKGSDKDIQKLMSGLGDLGREGHTALDAIAAQSDDLKTLTKEASTLLDALDTGRGQIANVVRDANRLAESTAGQDEAIKRTMRSMPELLDAARTATGELGELSKPLDPVAADLRAAAPDLDQALHQLPAVSADLRGLLPDLDGVLDKAPATLNRVPTFGTDVRSLVPEAELLLRDVNPMLAYLEPYGRDVGAMLTNFGDSMNKVVENGVVRPLRLAPIFNTGSLRGGTEPLTELDPNHWNNPYPAPGQAADPAPFEGDYPKVERAPK